MKRKAQILFILSLISILSYGQSNLDTPASFINLEAIRTFPQPSGYVNDFESLFTVQEKNHLDSIIREFEKQTTNQIAIVTISNIEPYESLKDFTTDLGNYWGVGQSDKNNGLIITISTGLRTIWIGCGLGTEKVLTNEVLQNIIASNIIPYFKRGEYFDGVKCGLMECINNWK